VTILSLTPAAKDLIVFFVVDFSVAEYFSIQTVSDGLKNRLCVAKAMSATQRLISPSAGYRIANSDCPENRYSRQPSTVRLSVFSAYVLIKIIFHFINLP
jgi:hypothetical protein